MPAASMNGATAPGASTPESDAARVASAGRVGGHDNQGTRLDCSAAVREAQARAAVRPREVRALLALLTGPQSRERLDRAAGASNSPDLVAGLRRDFGLSIPCERLSARDRDGRAVRPGLYSLTAADKARARELLRHRVEAR